MSLQKTDGQIAKAKKEWGDMANLESAQMMPSKEQLAQIDNARDAIPLAPEYRDLIMMSNEKLDYITDAVKFIKKEREKSLEEKRLAAGERGIPKIADSPDTRHATTTQPVGFHVSESGATSSHQSLRYDLVPRSLLQVAADTYTLGAKKHGERGYQRGLTDRGFILDRINHIQEHWSKLLHPSITRYESQQNEPTVRMGAEPNDEAVASTAIRANIGAMLWGLGFLTEVLENEIGKYILLEIVASGRVRNKERPMPATERVETSADFPRD